MLLKFINMLTKYLKVD